MANYGEPDYIANKKTYTRMKRAFLRTFIKKIDLDGNNPVKITTNELPIDRWQSNSP